MRREPSCVHRVGVYNWGFLGNVVEWSTGWSAASPPATARREEENNVGGVGSLRLLSLFCSTLMGLAHHARMLTSPLEGPSLGVVARGGGCGGIKPASKKRGGEGRCQPKGDKRILFHALPQTVWTASVIILRGGPAGERETCQFRVKLRFLFIRVCPKVS